MLGRVCRRCDAFNDLRAARCGACDEPFGGRADAPKKPAAVSVAPTSPAARLVLERGTAAPGAVFALGTDEVLAGRVAGAGAIEFPDDGCLGPVHATFVARGGAVRVRDEGAAGGVYVRLRDAVALRPGALFAVGDRLLRYGGPLPPAAPARGPTRRLGAPRPDRPTVVIEEWLEGGVGGRTWLRGGASVTIGRTGCAVDLGDDPWLSQAHAEVLLERDGTARLRDLGSAHGTFIRIAPGAEHALRDGDAVRLGHEVLRVEVG
jgi:ribosomal protein L40E